MRNDHLLLPASPPQPQHQPRLNSALCAVCGAGMRLLFVVIHSLQQDAKQHWKLSSDL